MSHAVFPCLQILRFGIEDREMLRTRWRGWGRGGGVGRVVTIVEFLAILIDILDVEEVLEEEHCRNPAPPPTTALLRWRS